MSKATIWKQAAGLFTGVFVGLFTGTVLWSRATLKPDKAPEVLQARRFELVDEKGVMRGRWTTLTGGGTALQLYNAAGKMQISLDTIPSHWQKTIGIPSGAEHETEIPTTTALRLYDPQGRTRVVLQSDGGEAPLPGEAVTGQTALYLVNPADRVNVTLSTATPGNARLLFGHDTNKGGDFPDSYQYVDLQSSLKEGVTFSLSGQGNYLFHPATAGRVKLRLQDRNGSLELPAAMQTQVGKDTKP